MDSMTQAALGAAIGGAVLGRRLGRKAILLGAVVGTLPDLDVIIDYGDAVANVTQHRGFSHSLFVLAGLGTGILFVVSFLAYWQRRSVRYLLIAVAVGALFLRSIVGIGTVLGYTPMVVHHLIEHTFDFLIASLILYAVLRSKPDTPENQTVNLSTDGGNRSEQQEE